MPDPISMLYDAAIGEEKWDNAVEAVADDIAAAILILGAGNPRQPDDLEIWSKNWDLGLLSDGGYSLSDVWNPMVNPDVAAGMSMPTVRAMHASTIRPEATLRTSHFLQSTVIRAGLSDYYLQVPLRETDLLTGGFLAKGPGKDFDTGELARIDTVLPHLGRALRLREQLDRHHGAARNLAALLDDLAYGVMLLDRHGEVVLTNARCETFRQRGDGIAVRRNRPDLGAAANAAVAAALAVVDLGNDSFPSVAGVPIPRSSGLPPYLARVYPGIGFASMAGAGAVRAAVLIDDPLDPGVLPDAALLSQMFGLTPAEAAVARLVPGHLARRAIAEHLAISENTVKTHLATIRDKLGARTTAEMVRILTRFTFGAPR